MSRRGMAPRYLAVLGGVVVDARERQPQRGALVISVGSGHDAAAEPT